MKLNDNIIIKSAKISNYRPYCISKYYISFQGCNQLTNKTIEAVRDHCKILKVLDIQGCLNISAELGCALGNLPTLHTVLMSKPGPYITDGVKNRSPAPPLLPSLLRKLRLH